MLHALLYKKRKFGLKAWTKIVKKLAAAGYHTLFWDFKLACMIKTYRSASCHQVLKIRECYIIMLA